MSLNLNDLNIEQLEIDQTDEGLTEYTDGHGLTEVGASSQTGNNTCGQGSCKAQELS